MATGDYSKKMNEFQNDSLFRVDAFVLMRAGM